MTKDVEVKSRSKKMFQLWPNKKDDTTTWKYIDCILESDGSGGRKLRKYILNPEFKYKHLDPNWPKDKIVEGI